MMIKYHILARIRKRSDTPHAEYIYSIITSVKPSALLTQLTKAN